MTETQKTSPVGLSLSYRYFRIAFVVGFVMQAMLSFIPTHKVISAGQTVSPIEMSHLVFRSGNIGLGFLFALVFTGLLPSPYLVLCILDAGSSLPDHPI